jgi:uncharacterized membrane protein YhiD involved in acid resistance
MAKEKVVKKNGGKVAEGVGIGVGLGMLAAAAAGAYYLYGTKEGAKKRVKIRGWMLKAKGEVMEKMENLKEVNEGNYNALVETVMKKYHGLKNIDPKEVDEMVSDLKKHWKNIKRHLDEADKTKSKKKPAAKK